MSDNRRKLVEAASKADHWTGLAEFAKYEMWAGGPDPHMALTAEMARSDGVGWEETAWRGLCYIGTYVVPSAYAIWSEWPWSRINRSASELEGWLRDNWPGLSLRRERKCVRSPVKLAKYLTTSVQWLKDKVWDKSMGSGWIAGGLPPKEKYEMAFEDVQTIYGMGRYVGQKYLEYGNRYLDFGTGVPDVRPVGGWSPRVALALLWPDHIDSLMGGDSPAEIEITNKCATKTKKRLKKEFGLDLSYYQLQVCLCDYKQSYIGRRQFPGRSQDSEIAYDKKNAVHWGKPCKKMFSARKRIFPEKALGELNGWDGVRKELGDCLAVHGYTWTDSRYDYSKSSNRLDRPVKW